jgi:hypothetical protein
VFKIISYNEGAGTYDLEYQDGPYLSSENADGSKLFQVGQHSIPFLNLTSASSTPIHPLSSQPLPLLMHTDTHHSPRPSLSSTHIALPHSSGKAGDDAEKAGAKFFLRNVKHLDITVDTFDNFGSHWPIFLFLVTALQLLCFLG